MVHIVCNIRYVTGVMRDCHTFEQTLVIYDISHVTYVTYDMLFIIKIREKQAIGIDEFIRAVRISTGETLSRNLVKEWFHGKRLSKTHESRFAV